METTNTNETKSIPLPFDKFAYIKADNSLDIDRTMNDIEPKIKSYAQQRKQLSGQVQEILNAYYGSVEKPADGSPVYLKRASVRSYVIARVMANQTLTPSAHQALESDIDNVLKSLLVSEKGNGTRLVNAA